VTKHTISNTYYFRKRHETLIKDTESKIDPFKESLGKIQSQLQQAKVKMMAKA
jgi:hypothetical protein